MNDGNGDAGITAAAAQGDGQRIGHKRLVPSLNADLNQINTAVTAHLQTDRRHQAAY